tara:strand:- start:1025 stop:1306 length:282 start_codon:yes stop_codon:yes gene_type:complete
MITRNEYLKALDIVEAYHKQLTINKIQRLREKLPDDMQRGDYVEYIGGSTSKYLTIGKKYRLRGAPRRVNISILNDKPSAMLVAQKFFKECEY